MPVLQITDEGFRLDDQPFRIISGGLHYFRVHPGLWADRLRKARLMGLNTVETYVPWNLHQPNPGDFRLDGELDLPAFLDLAAAEGLHVLLRPGPYICAEWEGGGLPSWLLADPGILLRSQDPRYLAAVDDYFERLLPAVRRHLSTNGGPVLAVQIENEYGAYGDDTAHLAHLARLLRRGGVDVPLFTCDQPGDLARGSLPGFLATANFGSRSEQGLAALRAHQPTGPLMCTEFWIGWFDRWGGHHVVRDPAQAARELDTVLATGASVNLYMFHGGTSFGFTNGANDKHTYRPTVGSYDYDSPLDEAGDPTDKYEAFREVIAKYAPVPAEPVPAPVRRSPPRASGSAPARRCSTTWTYSAPPSSPSGRSPWSSWARTSDSSSTRPPCRRPAPSCWSSAPSTTVPRSSWTGSPSGCWNARTTSRPWPSPCRARAVGSAFWSRTRAG